MHPKVEEILVRLMTRDDSIEAKEVEENYLYVRTSLTVSSDHAMYLKFVIADDVLRVEIKFVFGAIDERSVADSSTVNKLSRLSV